MSGYSETRTTQLELWAIGDTAAALDVDVRTVRRWVADGVYGIPYPIGQLTTAGRIWLADEVRDWRRDIVSRYPHLGAS